MHKRRNRTRRVVGRRILRRAFACRRVCATPVAALAGASAAGFIDTFATYAGATPTGAAPASLIQIDDLTASAMDNLDPLYSEYRGKFTDCDAVRSMAERMGVDIDGVVIRNDTAAWQYYVCLPVTEEQLTEIVELAIGEVTQ